MTLGERIRSARIARGLEAKQLAAMLGIAAASVSHLERGHERYSSLDLLARIADVLDLDADELRGLAGKLTTEEVGYIKVNPRMVKLLGAMMKTKAGEAEIARLVKQVERKRR